MNIYVFLALALGAPPDPVTTPFQTPISRQFDAALASTGSVSPSAYRPAARPRPTEPGRSISWQSPAYLREPIIRGQGGAPVYDESTLGNPAPGAVTGQVMPGQPPATYSADPFLGGGPVNGLQGNPDPNIGYGPVGPQPYRMGWTSFYEVGWIPSAGTTGGATGDFQVLEVDSAWRYTTGSWFPGWMFSWTPEFNYRSWQGPGSPDLPANAYRFASDFELATPGNQPVSFQLGFTPMIVSDLQQNLNHDAYQFDGRAVMFLQADPTLTIALGVTYWDRVKDRVLPYAGLIWTPDQIWEFRLMFPKSRISLFLGDFCGTSAWLYGGVEYNVEAFAIDLAAPNGNNEKIELVDYRATIGIRTESYGVSSFIEGGWVFAREANFLNGTPDFDINNGYIIRGGVQF